MKRELLCLSFMKNKSLLLLSSISLIGCAMDMPVEETPEVAMVDFGSGASEVHYQVVDGLAIMDGDIILGKASEVADGISYSFDPAVVEDGPVAAGAFVHNNTWPQGVIRYRIDPGLSGSLRTKIDNAIDDWNQTGLIQLTPDNGQGVNGHHVYFTGNPLDKDVGVSGLGYVPPFGFPKWQEIRLGGSVANRTVRHEIGHTIGLLHEQSRQDRDDFVEIFDQNIPWWQAFNFDVHGSEATTYRDYNISSLMHYHQTAFAIDKDYPTILPKGCSYGPLADQPDECSFSTSSTITDSDRLTVLRMYAGAPSRLRSARDNRCLRVAGASKSAGATVRTETCHANWRSQRWYRLYRKNLVGSGGAYQIVNQNSLMCLTVTGNNALVQEPCEGSPNQLFDLPNSGSGIKLRKDGTSRCVRSYGSPHQVILSTSCSSHSSRRWFKD